MVKYKERNEKIFEMYAKRKSMKIIAFEVGLTRQRVSQIINPKPSKYIKRPKNYLLY